MAAKKIKKLDDLTPQRLNANAGTQRGRGMLERSMGEVGFLGAMTAAADGEVFAGSKRLEVAGEVFADVEPIIVESDGTRPIVVVRTDVPNADDPRAVRAGILDNRVAEVSMDWDPDVFRVLSAEQPEALAGLWTDAELSFLMGSEMGDLADAPDPDHYSRKVESPVYVPRDPVPPPIADLYTDAKVDELLADIAASGLPEDVRLFLSAAAARHRVFNYQRIAEYYAHADAETQDHMERSALVIIDFGKAIENGFVELSDRLTELVGENTWRPKTSQPSS